MTSSEPGLRFSKVFLGSLVGLCLGALPACHQTSPYYVERTVQVGRPGATGEALSFAARQRRVLLRDVDEAHATPNNRAIDLALGGDWPAARAIWEERAPQAAADGADCAWQNNLGLARAQTGDADGALAALSRATHSCPRDDEIRSNLRAQLGGRSATP